MSEAEPTLPEMIRRALESRLGDVQVACPGIVVDYNPTTQTATIQPATNRVLPDEDGEMIEEVLPPIPNVPVVMFRTATLSITSPLAPGDTVQLVFNTRAPTEWRASGVVGAPQDVRLHGFGYPVAYPGYLSEKATKPDTDSSIGRPGGQRVHFPGATVNVGGGSNFAALANLVTTELNKIKTALSTLTVTTGAGSGGTVLAGTPYTTVGSVASSNLKAD